MRLLLYTPEKETANEVSLLSQMLDKGADLLFIRKPEFDDFALVDYLEQFDPKYYPKMLSTSLILTKEFELSGYHFTRDILAKNERYNDKVIEWLKEKQKIASASAHSMEEVQAHAGRFSQVIVSPVFRSISKPGHRYDWNYEELGASIRRCRELEVPAKFFAVGGVDIAKIDEIQTMHFDGMGLLGTLWNEPEYAMKNFEMILDALKRKTPNDQ